MPITLTHFRWTRPKHGVEVRPDPDGDLLTARDPGAGWEAYDPFEGTGLALVHALTAIPWRGGHEPKALAKFASKWGFLVSPRGPEPVDVWLQAIGELGWAFDIWAAIENDDHRALRYEVSENFRGTILEDSLRETLDAERDEREERYKRRARDEIHERHVSTARSRGARRAIKQWFETQAHKMVLDIVGPYLEEQPITFDLVVDDATGRLTLRAVPSSLLGAAYFQLADMIQRRAPTRRCPRCDRWFLVHPKSKRGHDTYCSDACRMAVYHQRKKARELGAAGRTPRAIARELGQPVGVVRGWLA